MGTVRPLCCSECDMPITAPAYRQENRESVVYLSASHEDDPKEVQAHILCEEDSKMKLISGFLFSNFLEQSYNFLLPILKKKSLKN